MVITTKALELQKDVVTIWNWRERDAHAGREPVGNMKFLSQRREGGKKLDSVRICFWLTGIGIALFGIKNHILKFKIDDEDREYTTVDQEAINHVREKLKDNKRALEALDFLEEKNRCYQNTKRHTLMMYLVAATTLFASLYFVHRMYQSNCEIGIWLSLFMGIIVTACLAGIPQAILDTDTTRMINSVKINFINDLLSEYVTYEDYPFIKAGDSYYIDLSDGMREVSLENVPYDQDTKMIGREYRYENLCWDSKGFSLQEITDVKVCSAD